MSYIDFAIPALDREQLQALMSMLATAFDIEQPSHLQQSPIATRRSFQLSAADGPWIFRLDPAVGDRPAALAFEREVCHVLENKPCCWPKVRRSRGGDWFAEITVGKRSCLAICQRFETDCRVAQQPEDLFRFGEHMAMMHETLALLDVQSVPAARRLDADLLIFSPLDQTVRYIGESKSTQSAYRFLKERIVPYLSFDGARVCHGDAHEYNALIRKDNSCFFIDTEYMSYGPQAYDIGTAAWNIGLHGNFEGLGRFLTGYQERGALSRELLDELWTWIVVRHVWWLGLRAVLADAVPIQGGAAFIRRELETIWRVEAIWDSLKAYR